jgi:two-component system, sporulation sensor kinase E
MNYPQKNKFVIIISLLIMLVFNLLLTGWLLNVIVCVVVAGFALILLNYIEKKRIESENKIIDLNNSLTERMQHHASEFIDTVVKLEVSEEKYRSLIEHASDAIYVIDFEGCFTEVNASMCRMTGYNREELLRLKIEQVIDPENLKAEPVLLGPDDLHTAVMKERRFIKKNGQVFDVEINVKRFTKDSVLVIARDITNRKVMQAGLREAELKFRTLAEKSMVGVYIVQKGTFIYVNPRFAQVFGYEPNELIGVSSVDVIISEQFKAIALEHVRARLSGEIESVNYEVMGRCKDGSNNWVEFYGTRTQIDDEPTIIGSMIDITERKEIEEELRLSEQKYKLLFDSNPLPMWMIAKSDLSIIAVNHAATKYYGYTADEFLSMTIKDVRPPEEWDEMYKGYAQEAPNWGNTITTRHRKKDGSMINVQIFGQDIMYEGQLVRLSIAIDITEKLRSEELLQKSEANLQSILNTTDTAYALFDKELNVLAFNHKTEGFVKNQLNHGPQKGDKLADLFSSERFSKFIEFTEQVLNGQSVSYEVDYPQADGSKYWFHVRLFPIKDIQGKILGLMMALYDITERKNTEDNLKVAYERIHNHINRIKNMAWKQSHYMRSPVANLKGLAELLKDNPADTETLNYMIAELERLDNVIVEMASDASSYD